ncbi:MAG TPA: 3-phosphoshikimate 1-carboxyvinyltransferase [Cyclobacteriaceae bacterium]|nr:3-phosphoshikimate 1-carboxyvinyltransferase [Cyclobacteriaceae bacterium]
MTKSNINAAPALHIRANAEVRTEVRNLPASKSISNRALILNALAGGKSILHHLSEANDTRLMRELIGSKSPLIDVQDAGTTMRFLTAYFAVTGTRKTLTGTPRMQERPIGILVDALRTLGAVIHYRNREGYPPIETAGFEGQKVDRLSIRGDVSSQFISAILMVAPSLPKGLTLELTGKVGSRPYIEMTVALMAKFGVKVDVSDNIIRVAPQPYHPTELTVESDWSGAGYWFAFAALAKDADIRLPRLYENSWQGDHVVRELMEALGVRSVPEGDMLRLVPRESVSTFNWDFTHSPDLAQTVAVVCAAKGIEATFSGLESLRIKETDRIFALQQELRKIGADLEEQGGRWLLRPAAQLPDSATFETYEDHRMAMAFSPLATRMNVTIIDPLVVRKSYPGFWLDVEDAGFAIAQS